MGLLKAASALTTKGVAEARKVKWGVLISCRPRKWRRVVAIVGG